MAAAEHMGESHGSVRGAVQWRKLKRAQDSRGEAHAWERSEHPTVSVGFRIVTVIPLTKCKVEKITKYTM